MASGRFISNTLGASHKFGDLTSDTHRVMYVLLLTHTDVEGRVDADPRVLNGRAFTLMGWTTDQVQEGLESLAAARLIHLYRVDGRQYAEVVDFEKHNKVRRDREKASEIPARASDTAAPVPHDGGSTPGALQESAGSSPQQVEVQVQVEVQAQEPRAQAPAAGARPRGTSKTPNKHPPRLGDFDPSTITLPDFIDPDVWHDFVDHRRRLHKVLTERAVELILADLAKTPTDADEMLRTSIKRGWTGVFPLDRPRDGPPRTSAGAAAWDAILAAAKDNRLPENLDPAAKAAMRAVGGWAEIAFCPQPLQAGRRSAFLNAYADALARDPVST